MALWLLFAALTAGVLAAILWPMLRGQSGAAPRSAHDTTLYAHQLEEIESDLERGLIAQAEAEAAKTEISRRLLRAADGDAQSSSHPASAAGQKKTAMVVFVAAYLCLPVLSLALYLTYGSPTLPDQPLSARLNATPETQQIDALIARVEARLREHPEDGEGWNVIAPVYMRLQRYDDAADAYERALRLLGESTARLSGYGEALVLANNGVVTEPARQAFAKAVAKDPSLLKPRFWLAMAKEQDGQYEQAVAAWRDLLRDAPADAPWRPIVEERLRIAQAQASGETGVQDEPPAQQAPAASEKKPPARGPTQEDIAAARDMTPEQRQAMINQMVEGLAARLAENGNDLEGWMRLVRAYSVLQRREEAAKALQKARDTFKEDQQALARLNALATSVGL